MFRFGGLLARLDSVEIAVVVTGEAVGRIHPADILALLVLAQRGPKALIDVAMRTRSHGIHLDILVSVVYPALF
jgi:hypothetical protein